MIIAPAHHFKKTSELARPLTDLKGIGPKRAQLLGQKELHTLMDLLLFVPIRYEDRREILPLHKATPGLATWVRGEVVSSREERFFRSGKRLFKIRIKDGTGTLDLRAHGDQAVGQVDHLRLTRGVFQHAAALARVAAIMMFSVPVTLTTSKKKCAPRRPPSGALALM